MAKKSGRQNLSNWLNNKVLELHDCGMLYSCILHTIILLVMSLTFLVPEPLQTIRLSLSFDSDSTDVEVGSEPILDIQTMEEVSESEISSDFNPENIPAVDSISSDIIETESSPLLEALEPSENNEVVSLDTNELDKLVIKEEKPPKAATVAPTGNRASNTPNQDSGGNEIAFGDQIMVNAIGERLKMAGAKTGDVQISIGWNTIDDIDLHIHVKNNNGGVSFIHWMNPIGGDGGELDVDMNALTPICTNQAVENVYWPYGASPNGEYIVGLHFFRSRTGLRSVPVTVVVKVGGAVKVFNVNCVLGQPVTEVTRFNRVN